MTIIMTWKLAMTEFAEQFVAIAGNALITPVA
jgi:hypothetical protein